MVGCYVWIVNTALRISSMACSITDSLSFGSMYHSLVGWVMFPTITSSLSWVYRLMKLAERNSPFCLRTCFIGLPADNTPIWNKDNYSSVLRGIRTFNLPRFIIHRRGNGPTERPWRQGSVGLSASRLIGSFFGRCGDGWIACWKRSSVSIMPLCNPMVQRPWKIICCCFYRELTWDSNSVANVKDWRFFTNPTSLHPYWAPETTIPSTKNILLVSTCSGQ